MGNRQISPVSASALRIARDLVLDQLRASQGHLGALDATILAALIQANVDSATGTVDDQLAFGPLDAPPPDAVRRPVSVSRLSHSLNMPFETVRRRLIRLAEQGLVETRASGVVVPAAYFRSEASRAAIVAVDALTARAWRRLAAAGFFEGRPLPEPGRRPAAHPARAVARLATDYALRFAHALQDVSGDYLDSLLFLQLTRLNTAHLGDEKAWAAALGPAAHVPDALKRPASVSRIARELGLPFETARRRMLALAEAGLCAAVEGGFIVPVEPLLRIAGDLAESNDTNLWRLYRSCALIGAVDDWRRDETPAALAAPTRR